METVAFPFTFSISPFSFPYVYRMIATPLRVLAAFLSILLFSACSHSLKSLYNKEGVIKKTRHAPTPVTSDWELKERTQVQLDAKLAPGFKVVYLGCGGFIIGDDHHSVLVDPYFTHVGPLKTVLGKAGSDKALIESELKPHRDYIKRTCKGVLVTHAHYDHLMDVPFVYNNYVSQDMKVYGSDAVDTLVGKVVNGNVKVIEKCLESWENPAQELLPGGRIRVTPIFTDHAPHWHFGIRLFSGNASSKKRKKYQDALDKSPVRSWKLGQTYAYLIDFLKTDGETVELRLYLESSAAPPPMGYVSDELAAQSPVHLALLGAASFHYTDEYPEGIVQNLKPQRLFVCHWEDFFKDYTTTDNRIVRATDLGKFVQRLNAVYPWQACDAPPRWFLPHPGTTVQLRGR